MINPESILLIIYFSNLILLGINATVLGFFYVRKLQLSKKERNIHKKYQEVIEKAQLEADRVIQNASQKSSELIKHTKYFQKEVEDKLANSLEKNLDENSSKLNEIFQSFQSANQEYFNHMKDKLSGFSSQHLDKVTESTVSEIQNFADDFKSQTLAAQNKISQELEDRKTSINEELENYKRQQLEKLDKSIKEIIYNTAQEVLSESISIDEHEKLIISALEKAKTQGIFSNN